MKSQLAKAHTVAFDAHEAHRLCIAESRKAAKLAAQADERVRQLRALELERKQTAKVMKSRRKAAR